jgi:TolA-binding protein
MLKVISNSFSWLVVPMLVLSAASLCWSQSATAEQTQVAPAEGPSQPDTKPASADSQAKKELQPTIDQRIKTLEDRIADLESLIRAQHGGTTTGDANDGVALKVAARDLLAGTGGSNPDSSSSVTPAVKAAQETPAASPASATPEIKAQVTTKGEPFPGDWTWLNSNGHQSDSPMSTKYFTPEFRADANYTLDFNHPKDDSLGGSTETFRSNEWQLEQISIGGDIHIDNVRGRILTMDGLFSTTTARNDASPSRGQWDLSGANKYVSEAWGGYHWDVAHGLNVDAGIFVSYIGLFSYYNFDNWTYQPSFVSSNTPWFFNGLRIQYFPTAKLKIEPWIINGWQTYARPNGKPGLGGQILWRPTPYLDLVFNNYGLGEDDIGYPGRSRVHTDDSIQVKYYDKPKAFFDKAAFTVTADAGCEYGGGPSTGSYDPLGRSPEMGSSSTYAGGVNCHNAKYGRPKQMFVGTMAYARFWFKKDLYAVTLGGGLMNNPGRYLTLLPPINGATAITGTPYFTENGGDRAQMHDGTITFDYMPSQFITFRLESGYRYSDTPYWTGRGGITPPAFVGGPPLNNGQPGQYACANGAPSGFGYGSLSSAEATCFTLGNGTGANTSAIWWPDLRTNQTVTTFAIMTRF